MGQHHHLNRAWRPGLEIRRGGSSSGGGGSGTMTSLSMPTSEFDVSDPSGDAIVTWDTQPANRVFAGPTTGADATPAFRALVAGDLAAHGSAQHSGNILPGGANQSLGDAYFDVGDIATPSTPSAGTVRLFLSLVTGELSVKKSDGSTVSLEAAGTGTVTSVAASVPAELSVSGSPVTTSGTLAFVWAAASGRKFIASPNDGSSGAYAGRAIVAADLPDLSSVYQPLDADLTAIAALTSAANKGLQSTGAGTWALYDLTTAGKALLDDADAAAQRTTLGVGTSDSPQFAAVNIGHASDTTLSRSAAGKVAVEGKAVPLLSGASDLVFAGPTATRTWTGPDADASLVTTAGTGLSLAGNTLSMVAAQRTRMFCWVIQSPAASSGGVELYIPFDCTVIAVRSVTNTGTVTFNVEERSSIGSAGTNVLSSDQVADATGEAVTSSFNNSSLALGNYLYLDIASVASTPGRVAITVEVTIP